MDFIIAVSAFVPDWQTDFATVVIDYFIAIANTTAIIEQWKDWMELDQEVGSFNTAKAL